jgi:diguanylate cyclase (GGDEF)-like protein/PAS domain S-box-containing protein
MSLLDGVDRMYSFRQVGDLPLFVSAGLADEDYLVQWRHHVLEYGIGLVILSLVVAGFELRQRRAEKALRKGEENLRTIADYTYDWEYWEGPQHELLYMSPSCERITGYSLAEFVADPGLLYRIIHPDDRHVMEEHRVNIAYTDVADVDFRIVRRDGEICWISHGCHAVHGKYGKYLGRRSSNRDITARKKAEEMLHVAAIAFDAQKGMSVTVTDANCVILLVNSSFTQITGYSAEEAVGKKPQILKSGRHDANFYTAMWKSINDTGVWEGEIWNRRKNGQIYPEYLTITAVKNQNGIIANYVATFNDITLIKTAEEEINNLAFFDSLTQLPNRRMLIDRLKQALAFSARNRREGALLFIDLDNFKTLNDTLGHDIGDLLLQQVARRLETCVRESDTVARLGGDDFVVMLEDLSEQAIEAAAQTEVVGEKILAILNQPYQLGTHEYHCSASIGVTLFSDHEEVDELMRQADIAMYQAKKVGRNILRFFDPQMQDTVNIRADLEGEIRKAIDNQQFRLYYQIQVDHLQRPFGAEALIRWIHPERGFINPAAFIPMAEETGLILPIGQWVLETACAQIKEWQKNVNTRDLVLAVNVSAMQFRQVDFVARVQAAMQRHSINPMLLKLELTESMLLEKIEDTIATMTTLKEIGVRFSLDDFGTGYSSLQYLKRLPLNQLKIDQSFVRDLATDNNDRAIVRTIVAMALSLNLDVIAEGVETEEQRQLIQDSGCKHFQGYLFGKPVPIEQFEALLKQG